MVEAVPQIRYESKFIYDLDAVNHFTRLWVTEL